MLERMRCGQMMIGGWCKVSVNFDCKHHRFRPFVHHCCSSLCLLGCLPITSHCIPHTSPFCCRPLALVLTAHCLVPVSHWHGFALTCKASAPVPTQLDYYTLFLLLLVFVLDLYIMALVLAQSRSLLCLVFLRLCVLTKELLPRHASLSLSQQLDFVIVSYHTHQHLTSSLPSSQLLLDLNISYECTDTPSASQ